MEDRLRQVKDAILVFRETLKIQDSLCSHLSSRLAGCEQAAGLSFTYPVLLTMPTGNGSRGSFSELYSSEKMRTLSLTTLASSSSSAKRRASGAGTETAGLDDASKKRKTTHKPCQFEGCRKLAHGPVYNFCLRHGGGYRCLVPGCSKSAYSTKYCSRHGGGPRCQFPGGCGKGAISNSSFCRRHGGGKRCMFPNCTQGSRAGYDFCLAHGGYTPCSFAQCPCPALHGGEFCRQHNSIRQSSVSHNSISVETAAAAAAAAAGVSTNIFAGLFGVDSTPTNSLSLPTQ